MRTFRRVFENKPFLPSPRAARTIGTRRKVLRKPGLTLKMLPASAFTLTSDGSLKATYPKDRIYALLGIADGGESLAIRPDYRITTGYEEVYAQVAKILVQNGHPDILSLCRPNHSQDRKLPSWAPDWSKPIPAPWGGFLEDGLFQASGDGPFVSRKPDQLNTSTDVLIIEARFVGTLREIGSKWKPKWHEAFDYNGACKLFAEVKDFLSRSGTRYSVEEKQEAVWRIPIGDKEMNALGMVQRATKEFSGEKSRARSVILDQSNRRKSPDMVSYLGMMKDMYDCRPFFPMEAMLAFVPMLR